MLHIRQERFRRLGGVRWFVPQAWAAPSFWKLLQRLASGVADPHWVECAFRRRVPHKIMQEAYKKPQEPHTLRTLSEGPFPGVSMGARKAVLLLRFFQHRTHHCRLCCITGNYQSGT